MGGWRARCERMLIVAAAAALCSCTTTLEHENGPPKDPTSFEKKGERFQKSLAKRLEKQLVSPEEDAAKRMAQAADGILKPGEPIWIPDLGSTAGSVEISPSEREAGPRSLILLPFTAMGKVIGALKAKFTGKMDFAKASAAVKQLLT